jgi:subtilase family serine protease
MIYSKTYTYRELFHCNGIDPRSYSCCEPKEKKGREGKMKKGSVVLVCLFVIAVLGESNLQFPGTREVLAAAGNAAIQKPPNIVCSSGASSPTGVSPQQIRAAYNLPSTGGSGTIAIIDCYDDPSAESDLNVFSSQYGLPPVNNTNFEKHMMVSNITGSPPGDDWSMEISLDTQWAHAIAPNAKILLIEEANDTSIPGAAAAIDYARNRPDVVAISMSWGVSEGIISNETDYDSYFTSSYGATFFASSGDSGAQSAQNWPAASPNVVGVGGTVLTFAANGSVASETGWSYSGGGESQLELEPSYQSSYFYPGSQSFNGYRGVPDVSYAADPVYNSTCSGFSIYDSNYSQPGWGTEIGTSAGAPQWAAIQSLGRTCSNNNFYTLANSSSHGCYYNSTFRDIKTGNNGWSAGPGYDFVTGLGSPLTTAFGPLVTNIYGPSSVVNNVLYNYTTNTVTDPVESRGSGLNSYVNVTGPGTAYDYFPLASVGEPMTWSEIWVGSKPGTYLLQAWVEDGYGLVSNFASMSVNLNATVLISASGGGTTSLLGTYYYNYGTLVNITAYPNANQYFWFWTANNSATGDRYYGAQTGFTINVTEDYNITAWFGSYNYTQKYPGMEPFTVRSDINFDGVVNMGDVIIVQDLYGETSNSTTWFSSGANMVDILLVRDGLINMADLVQVLNDYGHHI